MAETVTATAGPSQEDPGLPADGPVRPPDAIPSSGDGEVRALRIQARVGTAIGVLGLLLAVAAWSQAGALRAEAERREEVREAAELMVLRITTFDGSRIEEWLADTRTLATGDYAEELTTLYDPEIRESFAAFDVQSVGVVESSFVQEVSEDTALVFAVVRQSYTFSGQDRQISDELRMEVELARIDGQWLTADVKVLGPSTIAQIDPEGAGQPTPDEGG